MRKLFRGGRVLSVTLATATLVGASGVAFAVVQSVDSSPQPQVVIPSSATVRTDRPATHNAADDRRRPTEERHGAAHSATHDVGDDKAVDSPATHDVGDDKGGSTGGHRDSGDEVTPAPTPGVDDHGGSGRSGRDGGDSGASPTGSDDHGHHGSDG